MVLQIAPEAFAPRSLNLRKLRRLRVVEPPKKTARRLPATRAACIDGPRPCPYLTCRHHLGLSVTYAGSLQFTYPGRATERMAATCALDVAEGGAKTLDEVAALLNMTGENARRIEARALGKLRALISHLNPHEK